MVRRSDEISESTKTKLSIAGRKKGKLSTTQIKSIRQLFLDGHSISEISLTTNFSIHLVSDVINGRSYSWFEPEILSIIEKLKYNYGDKLFNNYIKRNIPPILAPDNNIYINVNNANTLLRYHKYSINSRITSGFSQLINSKIKTFDNGKWRLATEIDLSTKPILDLAKCLISSVL